MSEWIDDESRYLSVLTSEGCKVMRVVVDFAFSLDFGPLSNACLLRIESPFLLKSKADKKGQRVDPSRVSTVCPALALFGKGVVSAHIYKNGALELTFEGELTLFVEPDERFEAWTFSTTNGDIVVSLPGGGIGEWPSRNTP